MCYCSFGEYSKLAVGFKARSYISHEDKKRAIGWNSAYPFSMPAKIFGWIISLNICLNIREPSNFYLQTM